MEITKKLSARKLPKSLTNDKNVISSMRAIQRAGFWAFIIALFIPFIIMMSLYGSSVSGSDPSPALWIYPFIAIYLGYSGLKLNRLEGNVTAMLIVNIILSLLLIIGILPLLLLAMSAIALVKINVYNKWHKTKKLV